MSSIRDTKMISSKNAKSPSSKEKAPVPASHQKPLFKRPSKVESKIESKVESKDEVDDVVEEFEQLEIPDSGEKKKGNFLKAWATAVPLFETLLRDAKDSAATHLDANPEAKSAYLPLNLFDSIDTDDGKVLIHTLLYAPLNMHSRGQGFVKEFESRFWSQWFNYRNIPADERKDTDPRALTVFRDLQQEMLGHNLYLVDHSSFGPEDEDGKRSYSTNIRLFRTRPPKPAGAWHGYDYIHGLGPIQKPQPKQRHPQFQQPAFHPQMMHPAFHPQFQQPAFHPQMGHSPAMAHVAAGPHKGQFKGAKGGKGPSN